MSQEQRLRPTQTPDTLPQGSLSPSPADATWACRPPIPSITRWGGGENLTEERRPPACSLLGCGDQFSDSESVCLLEQSHEAPLTESGRKNWWGAQVGAGLTRGRSLPAQGPAGAEGLGLPGLASPFPRVSALALHTGTYGEFQAGEGSPGLSALEGATWGHGWASGRMGAGLSGVTAGEECPRVWPEDGGRDGGKWVFGNVCALSSQPLPTASKPWLPVPPACSRGPLPGSHAHTGPAAFPAPKSTPPRPSPSSGPSPRSCSAHSPAVRPACSLCSLHPDPDFPSPLPCPGAAPFGKPSLGRLPATLPRPGTKACANAAGTGPGPGLGPQRDGS